MRRGRLAAVLVVVFLWGATVWGQDDPAVVVYADQDARFLIGVDTWISSGESWWDIHFLEALSGVGLIRGKSRLEWEDLDSVVYAFRADYRFSPLVRFSGMYAFGDIRDGNNTDTDWLSGGGLSNFTLSRSTADTTGDLRSYDLTLYLRLNELVDMTRIGGTWDLFLGYRYHKEDLRDRNGARDIYFEQAVYEPFAGLDSTYSFEWQSARVGFRGDVSLAPRFHVTWLFAGLVGTEFRGEGYWNLRDDFRDQSPNFVQRASSGMGWEVRTSMRYDLTPSVYAELGYWAIQLRAESGSDTTYFADGDVGAANLDTVETARDGLFVGLGGRF